MAAINLLDVMVLNAENAPFLSGFAFQITFECVTKLRGELEWRVVYVGSAKSESLDQELDSVLVGPVPLGVSRFVLDVPAPDPSKIPSDDLLGATAIMITCSYGGKEFVKVGYWVSNSPKNPPAEGTSGRLLWAPCRLRPLCHSRTD
jgi:histone chaperone ASF1